MSEINYKILILGGGTSGISAATRARRINENAEISIIEESNYLAYQISSIPLFISGVIKNKDSIIAGNEEKLLEIYNIKIFKNYQALKIKRDEKKVIIKNLKTEFTSELYYDKLIIATGNNFLYQKNNGFSGQNFFTLKNIDDAISIRNYIEKTSARNITIIGSNHFSLNIANNLVQAGFIVSIIENSNKLIGEFDDEFNYLIKEEVIRSGVKLYLENQIKKIFKNQENIINKIELNNTVIDTQIVIYMDNMTPNTIIAHDSGLSVGKEGGIIVNIKMQTSDPNIFAIGGAAQTFNSISREREISTLIGPSQFQGRVAGTVAGGGDMNFTGIIGTRYLKFNKLSIGMTGLTENVAKELGFEINSFTVFSGNYERFIPGATQLHLKIISDKTTRRILGALVSGKGDGVDKRLDVFAASIYSGLVVDDLINLNLCYSPEISTYKDPVNIVGMVGANRLDGISQSVKLNQITSYDKVTILDVRSKNEYQKEHLLNSIWIPLNQLRKKINEIPKDKSIYIYGHIGIRGYIAERILKGSGFTNVYNIDGGIASVKISESMR
jgi:NADPH-dependent 2,4-dienoyl-CoA reductase/sulfur reductase-like enzyme/rhodanese-related sulfurtransferase